MTQPQIESYPEALDHERLEQTVHQLGLLYGINHLEVEITPGVGTSCAKLESGGLLVTIDPKQVAEGEGASMTHPEYGSTTPEINALFMTAHELGHAKDFLDPAFRLPTVKSPSSKFFDCLIDDTVIDTRNRRVPLFDAKADAVYAHQIPSDLTTMPKHAQLMWGIRVSQVMSSPGIAIDPEVAAIIDGLSHFERDDTSFNIPEVLTDPQTTLQQRRRIAETYILPHYQALLEEDKQEQQNNQGDGDDTPKNGDGGFQEVYNQYEEAVHGHRHESHDDNNGNQQTDKSDDKSDTGSSGKPSDKDDKGSGGLAEQLCEVLKAQANKDRQAKQSAKEATQKLTKAETEDGEQVKSEQLAQLAGTLAGELQLSQGDAESYVRSLDKWAPTINGVSDVFMRLAAPSDIIRSPRYKRGAYTEGLRLHPLTMAGIALQLETDQEQAIWQPIVRQAHRQEVSFGGLDVHLLVDVSGSMAGVNAQSAADTSLCLIEGLQLARHKVTRQVGQYHQPDVRTQIIAFGSGAEILSPLSYEPTGQQKGRTYSNLLRPNSNSTLVNSALKYVAEAAAAKPKRDVIAIIISDGRFGDHDQAAKSVAEMPKSAYIAHLVIGNGAQNFISQNNEVVANPGILPDKLASVLTDYIRRSQL